MDIDIYEIEKEIMSLDNIKLQKLISWLPHSDIAIAVLLFSQECGNKMLLNTSSKGEEIVKSEMEKYKETFESHIGEVVVKIKKYINLIVAGKGLEHIEE